MKTAKSDLQLLTDSFTSFKIERDSDRLNQSERSLERVRAIFNESQFAQLFSIIKAQLFGNSALFRPHSEGHQTEFINS
jgi:hypothetical protein